jgi:hypothetical protein
LKSVGTDSSPRLVEGTTATAMVIAQSARVGDRDGLLTSDAQQRFFISLKHCSRSAS